MVNALHLAGLLAVLVPASAGSAAADTVMQVGAELRVRVQFREEHGGVALLMCGGTACSRLWLRDSTAHDGSLWHWAGTGCNEQGMKCRVQLYGSGPSDSGQPFAFGRRPKQVVFVVQRRVSELVVSLYGHPDKPATVPVRDAQTQLMVRPVLARSPMPVRFTLNGKPQSHATDRASNGKSAALIAAPAVGNTAVMQVGAELRVRVQFREEHGGVALLMCGGTACSRLWLRDSTAHDGSLWHWAGTGCNYQGVTCEVQLFGSELGDTGQPFAFGRRPKEVVFVVQRRVSELVVWLHGHPNKPVRVPVQNAQTQLTVRPTARKSAMPVQFTTIGVVSPVDVSDDALPNVYEEASTTSTTTAEPYEAAASTFHNSAEGAESMVASASHTFLYSDPISTSSAPTSPSRLDETTSGATVPATAVDLNGASCGLRANADRILGGNTTSPGEFPWLAQLVYRTEANTYEVWCAGSLINHRHVLTAAHCLQHEVEHVILGENDVVADCTTEFNQIRCARKAKIIKSQVAHPGYNRKSKANDIALILLTDTITYSENVRPACIPLNPGGLNIGKMMWTVGWGLMNAIEPSTKLRKVMLPVVKPGMCSRMLKRTTISAQEICAGGEKDRDSCQGDSGGPLMEQDPSSGRLTVHGIVSFGAAQCGMDLVPSIYTRVSHYVPWIVDTISRAPW